MEMNLKTLYMAVLIVFYASIPVLFTVEKIIFLARGYEKELAFEKKDAYADKMVGKIAHPTLYNRRP